MHLEHNPEEPCLIHKAAHMALRNYQGMTFDSLTNREKTIVRALRAGDTTREVRQRYSISSTRLNELGQFV